MMNSREDEVEYVENIECTTIGKTDTESRNTPIANDELYENRSQAEGKFDCRCIPEKTIAWKIFKAIVFLICLIFVIKESVEFYNIYSEYPTNLVQESTMYNNKVKLPAVTICFKNTVTTKTFCNDNPDWCEKPNNIKEFCKNNPIHCKGDTSNLTIPMTGYYTNNSREFEEVLRKYLFTDEFNDPDLYRKYRSVEETKIYIISGGLFYKCYSRNLHLYQSRSKPDTYNIPFNTAKTYYNRQLELYRIELFSVPGDPQVFLGVHSPFIPIDPVLRGHAIRSGYFYSIRVQLEKEEHLLPPPYQTNCRENGPSKDVKNFTNPNSYEMCLEICNSELAKAAFGCDTGMVMVSSPSNFCESNISINSIGESVLMDKHLICLQNCRPGCLKLHYKYKLFSYKYPGKQDNGITDIEIVFSNKKVTLLRHVPLYGSGAMTSYIGGLLAYWLGISVLNSLDIIEKFFGVAVKYWERFGKNKVHETPTYETLH